MSDCAVKELSNSSIPSKHRLEEDKDLADNPSKQQKGKVADIMAPTVFHHSCPLPQKRKAVISMAKVHFPAFLFTIIVQIVCRIYNNETFFFVTGIR